VDFEPKVLLMSAVQAPLPKLIAARPPSEPFALPSAPPTPLPAEVPDVPIWRLTVEQYHQMLDADILHDGDPVELLEGWLVQKMTKKPPTVTTLRLLEEIIRSMLTPEYFVITQDPVTTSESEPEPDLAVVRGNRRNFIERHPTPGEVALVVEVSWTTLKQDRKLMQRIYACAGIPEYWIVNLVDGCIEVYTQPSGPVAEPRYEHRQDYAAGQSVPVNLGGQTVGEVPVSGILP
jgi:Uma2 family endonuclease